MWVGSEWNFSTNNECKLSWFCTGSGGWFALTNRVCKSPTVPGQIHPPVHSLLMQKSFNRNCMWLCFIEHFINNCIYNYEKVLFIGSAIYMYIQSKLLKLLKISFYLLCIYMSLGFCVFDFHGIIHKLMLKSERICNIFVYCSKYNFVFILW